MIETIKALSPLIITVVAIVAVTIILRLAIKHRAPVYLRFSRKKGQIDVQVGCGESTAKDD